MWAEYCPENDGLAVQSTERRLQHQFVRMLKGRDGLFFRDIDYVDHKTYNPRSHGVPEQAFLKQRQFVNEREIRFAWWVHHAISGTNAEVEVMLSALPDYLRLPFDLASATDSIVLHPKSSAASRFELEAELESLGLTGRIRASRIGQCRESNPDA